MEKLINDFNPHDKHFHKDSVFDRVNTIQFDDRVVIVYQTDDFKGYPLTFAELIEIKKREGNIATLAYKFRATMCSPEDNYSPELGESIAIGRIMKADNDRMAAIALDVRDLHTAPEMISQFTKAKLDKLEQYVDEKQIRKGIIHDINSHLSEMFSEFK